MFKHQIDTLLRSSNVTPEGTTTSSSADYIDCLVSIETGRNEGYFVCVQIGRDIANCRYHSKDEALTALGVLLTFLPNH